MLAMLFWLNITNFENCELRSLLKAALSVASGNGI